MKAIKVLVKSIIFLFLISSCNEPYIKFSSNNQVVNDTDTIDKKLWLLKHRRYQEPGIYLYNETSGVLEKELELPKNLESPHAIAFDGKFLWVGGIGEEESIYQIDPHTGAIISEIPNIRTEGIAVDGDYIYYSVYETNIINKIDKNGTFVEEIVTQNASLSIPDIAIDGNKLYYLRYTVTDPIVKLNLSNKNESFIPLSGNIDTYCLTIFNSEIIGVTLLNGISRFKQSSGDFISSNTTGIEGWITAIAPHYETIEPE
ncbi:hypothetical protein MK851_04300 [Tenacibaculum sp. 1B UA]|uniref:YncE family protein n=1 Tax=Tenacibaculum sp. 1B UA TaxID=2922252 RepID=UPI002A242679|nr:hypothetical protein [Tenacibaculum sp. 1B UA]MDX8552847.1 hypothetical protein [Tenacibaculum sp. 1B UA]